MQIKDTPRPKTDFAVRTANMNNNVKTSESRQDDKHDTVILEEQVESFKPSKEALLKLYLEEVRNAQKRAAEKKEERVDIGKLMRIAQNIMSGKQVPSKDENYLVKHNLSLYMAAKNLGSLKKPSGKAKSVLEGDKKSVSSTSGSQRTSTTGIAGNNGSADGTSYEFAGNNTVSKTETPKTATEIANSTTEAILENANGPLAAKNNSFDISRYQATSERNYGMNSMSSSSGMKKTKKAKKKFKRLNYNFKLVSSQILKAKTSTSARKAAGSARRQTASLRKKMISADYDTTYVRIALVHAEAIERVAKKKVKHLLEEERLKRGGPCDGDNDKAVKEEQKKLDEQAFMEMMGNYDSEEPHTEGEALVELFSETVQQPAPVETIDLEELMIEFQKLMEDSFDDMGSLDELTDELMAEAVVDMDPEDLKMLKIKHRSKEQQEIAEADARYLRAFFEKLQRDQQQTSAAISQMAEEAAADMPMVQAVNTTGKPAVVIVENTAAPAIETTAASAAQPTKSAAQIVAEHFAESPNIGQGTGINTGSPSINIGGISVDISI